MVKSLIWLILVVIAAVIIGAFIWGQDANQFKPDIEALIAEHSDAGLKINGDLSWQLWPPLTLWDDLGALYRRPRARVCTIPTIALTKPSKERFR